ncbi:trimeric intracellular cation channel family protein [Microbacterium sp. SORGH_AS_0888]|uniref:trimeric intracellular cation channel family protein n=1 Tax=Microbacterium sp. SORGH_AS_0888 TaxID=3041791 RepID=UPI0027812F6E|nr:TRIC cation channel family protein [Microbacterium sp. SORGH_AS_0888]MDQ1129808.1 putative membrane protein YeiH [Microbacterium sp. SORGH_AS_0888]
MATGLFAVEGAAAAAHAGLDLLGVLVVGFLVALAGGILRDVLLGDLPPAAFSSRIRIIVALGASLLTFGVVATIDDIPTLALATADAVGLALFAVGGAEKAAARGANLWVVTALGTVTATGGGLVRDVVLDRLPFVLTQSVYGTAALAGALTTGILLRWTRARGLALLAGFAAAFALRTLAIVFDWHLPRLTT